MWERSIEFCFSCLLYSFNHKSQKTAGDIDQEMTEYFKVALIPLESFKLQVNMTSFLPKHELFFSSTLAL